MVFTVTTIAGTIVKKYLRAIKSEQDSREYFEDLSTVPTDQQIKLWDTEISKAEELRTNRPEAMDVMEFPKVSSIHLPIHLFDSLLLAPTLAGKRLELLQQQERGMAGESAWMIAGLKLEEQQ